MSLQAAAWGAWYGVHHQGELEVQHFAGLQQYLGYSILCSALGCNDIGKPYVKGLLHPPEPGANQPHDDMLLHACTAAGVLIKHLKNHLHTQRLFRTRSGHDFISDGLRDKGYGMVGLWGYWVALRYLLLLLVWERPPAKRGVPAPQIQTYKQYGQKCTPVLSHTSPCTQVRR